jgi:multiple sugar transport system permease protein
MLMNTLKLKLKAWFEKNHINKNRIQRLFIGKQDGTGIITKILIYGIMIGISYVFLYPILYMLSKSLMPIEDIVNPMVKWLPTALNLNNYMMVLEAFDLRSTLIDSLLISGLSTLVIVASSGLIGFGLARYDFPFKKTMFVFIILMFALPPQILSIPRYVIYNEYGLIGSIYSFLIPAFLGQGLNQTIFILIFYQFFKTVPKVLTEAAQIEGAGHFTVFMKIYVPLSGPAIITTTLYSFIWYWNSGALTTQYMGRNYTTVMMALNRLKNTLMETFPEDKISGFSPLSEGVIFAGNIIALIPLLILYIVLQKWFVESVDRAGITGE